VDDIFKLDTRLLNAPGMINRVFKIGKRIKTAPKKAFSPKAFERRSQCHQLRSQPTVASSTGIGSTSNKVISMLGAAKEISQMLLMEPHSFEELSQAIQALRERKVVVLNMTILTLSRHSEQ